MLSDLTIFEKHYELTLWLYPTVSKFPKHQRFVLGQQLHSLCLAVLQDLLCAGQSLDKRPHLEQASVHLDQLRMLVRLAKDLRFISVRQYGFAADKINEVGKMLGGWLRATGRRPGFSGNTRGSPPAAGGPGRQARV